MMLTDLGSTGDLLNQRTAHASDKTLFQDTMITTPQWFLCKLQYYIVILSFFFFPPWCYKWNTGVLLSLYRRRLLRLAVSFSVWGQTWSYCIIPVGINYQSNISTSSWKENINNYLEHWFIHKMRSLILTRTKATAGLFVCFHSP